MGLDGVFNRGRWELRTGWRNKEKTLWKRKKSSCHLFLKHENLRRWISWKLIKKKMNQGYLFDI